MSSLVVSDGAEVRHDPSDSRSYAFDWGTNNLSDSAIIATSKFKIACVTQTQARNSQQTEQAVINPRPQFTAFVAASHLQRGAH